MILKKTKLFLDDSRLKNRQNQRRDRKKEKKREKEGKCAREKNVCDARQMRANAAILWGESLPREPFRKIM